MRTAVKLMVVNTKLPDIPPTLSVNLNQVSTKNCIVIERDLDKTLQYQDFASFALYPNIVLIATLRQISRDIIDFLQSNPEENRPNLNNPYLISTSGYEFISNIFSNSIPFIEHKDIAYFVDWLSMYIGTYITDYVIWHGIKSENAEILISEHIDDELF